MLWGFSVCVLWAAEKFQETFWKDELRWILGLLRTALRIFSYILCVSPD